MRKSAAHRRRAGCSSPLRRAWRKEGRLRLKLLRKARRGSMRHLCCHGDAEAEQRRTIVHWFLFENLGWSALFCCFCFILPSPVSPLPLDAAATLLSLIQT